MSPFTLRRADRNATVALSDTQIWGRNKVNELRGGMFYLNNTRQLDDPFLDMTNDGVGVPNPATFFDSSIATTRLGHYVGRPGGTMERFSFGGPNDSFNKRRAADLDDRRHVQLDDDAHAVRMGGEFRRNEFNTNLPEEQATEFEKFDNFTQLLRGLATEADTQFGITDKQFRFNDFNVFVSDEWRLSSQSLTLNLGVRYEFFGLPKEVNGRIGNVDFEAITNTENPVERVHRAEATSRTPATRRSMRRLPHPRRPTTSTRSMARTGTTSRPRLGLRGRPTERQVVRGGYGIFFDRPSAAFINTVFSNYPFLREQEVTFPGKRGTDEPAHGRSRIRTSRSTSTCPNRIVRTAGTGGTYQIRDGTNVTAGADGTPNTIDRLTGLPRGATSRKRSNSAPWTATSTRPISSSTTSACSGSSAGT